PCRSGDVPALVLLVLRNRVEVPQDLSGFRIDGDHVAAGNMALTARRADVDDPVIDLRRRRKPVAQADGGGHIRIPLPDDIEDDARLAVVAEPGDGLARSGVEREEERPGG